MCGILTTVIILKTRASCPNAPWRLQGLVCIEKMYWKGVEQNRHACCAKRTFELPAKNGGVHGICPSTTFSFRKNRPSITHAIRCGYVKIMPWLIERYKVTCVLGFAVSALASNWERLGKPFNPLLGETYELEREEFRIVCEQVSHHPPVSAFHAEGKNKEWSFHGSIHPKLKFWGKSVEIQPKGTVTLELHK